MVDGREVILEFHQVGNFVKVSAVDPRTLTEVSIVGDPAASARPAKPLGAAAPSADLCPEPCFLDMADRRVAIALARVGGRGSMRP